MESKWEIIQSWAQSVENYSPLPWDRMPEIELYMDQVITYMEKQLSFYRRNEQSKMLTPSMINNYVKDALLPRPDRKKYSREHLASLMMICLLKPILSIPDIQLLNSNLRRSGTPEEVYTRFVSSQDDALKNVPSRLLKSKNQRSADEDLHTLAMQLTLEANACRIAAEKILEVLEQPETSPKEQNKDKGKAKAEEALSSTKPAEKADAQPENDLPAESSAK